MAVHHQIAECAEGSIGCLGKKPHMAVGQDTVLKRKKATTGSAAVNQLVTKIAVLEAHHWLVGRVAAEEKPGAVNRAAFGRQRHTSSPLAVHCQVTGKRRGAKRNQTQLVLVLSQCRAFVVVARCHVNRKVASAGKRFEGRERICDRGEDACVCADTRVCGTNIVTPVIHVKPLRRVVDCRLRHGAVSRDASACDDACECTDVPDVHE